MSLIFVDCEAYGKAPGFGQLTEFGAVEFVTRQAFYGVLVISKPSTDNPAIPEPTEAYDPVIAHLVMERFTEWLRIVNGTSRPIFVSDNPAFDYQWINYEFAKAGMDNPFGHSARRISDFYAGLCGDWSRTQQWKKFRRTKHDHNPVNDAMGNVEAFETILERYCSN